jgi:hypothetical protein
VSSEVKMQRNRVLLIIVLLLALLGAGLYFYGGDQNTSGTGPLTSLHPSIKLRGAERPLLMPVWRGLQAIRGRKLSTK